MSIRTLQKYIYYALQSYYSGLSKRKTSQRLSPIIKRNHVSIWNWIQMYKPQKIIQKKRKVMEFIIDETLLKVSNEYVWLYMVAIEPIDK
jgi:putative transposase